MKYISMKHIKIMVVSAMILYLMVSIYFNKHTFFNTFINGVDISLKTHDAIDDMLRDAIKGYKLELVDRDGETEVILGHDIGMRYNKSNSIAMVYRMQNPFKWLSSLFTVQNYYIEDLYSYNKEQLSNKINALNCFNKQITEPQSVSFKYTEYAYEVTGEVYGNKIHKERFNKAIEKSILQGKTSLNLDASDCYENPKYTLNSDQTLKAKELLNKYVSSKITYLFGNDNEIVDGNTINKWLSVDEHLEVSIDEKAVREYVKWLSKKYDTVSKVRQFKTSTNKIVEVKGGFYGWKINQEGETQGLLEHIKRGAVIQKEPLYTQKARSRGDDDIGDTYVEINITKQYLWFYKDGKLVTQGSVVTGNPSTGNATPLGVYMLNYKQQGSILRGPQYEAEVTYWMPFNGNIGIHDANWRYSFGREIYKSHGSHGCVNAPMYLVKKIFEHIEEGTPVICYEEEVGNG